MTKKQEENPVVYKNTKTYLGVECMRCNSTLHYKSTGGCVKCTQTEAREAYRRFPDAIKSKRRDYYSNNKDTHRNTVLLSTYGISLEEYNQILSKQGNACAICKLRCSTGRNLCVDHDHSSGVVRGLLCLNCNRGIGNMRDDPTLLTRAANYIKKYDIKKIK